jgi:Na+/proline symporter
VWNDCLQFGVYMLGAIAVFYVLISRTDDGIQELLQFGNSTGRFAMFDFDPSLTKKNITFWSGLIGGAFLALATHGADHMMVQRYLCARSQGSASRALGLSGFVVFVQFTFFLLIGVGLAYFFSKNASPTPIEKGDQALVTFVVNFTSTGLKGLVLAAVFSASMSSSLNAVTSSLMSDWFSRQMAAMSERKSLFIARVLTIVFAVVQAAVAIVAYKFDLNESTVNSVLGIAGFSTGLILGLYFLGLLVPKASEPVALAAFSVGTVITCLTVFCTSVHYLWYTLVGSGTIVIVGLLLSSIVDSDTHVQAESR